MRLVALANIVRTIIDGRSLATQCEAHSLFV